MSTVRTVYLVDDDDAVSHALGVFLRGSGYRVQTFRSAEAFLEVADDTLEGVLLLDQRMAGMSGLDLQGILQQRGVDLPIIFISAHSNVRVSVTAMKAGALNFLEKPFKNIELLESIREAMEAGERGRELRSHLQSLDERYRSLTEREREVMRGVVRGMPNRALAEMLGVCERTVEVHRARVMKKMGAESLPDLVRKHALYSQHR